MYHKAIMYLNVNLRPFINKRNLKPFINKGPYPLIP